jgi:predicted  nucleic acid-binding Zn-ribbon protein
MIAKFALALLAALVVLCCVAVVLQQVNVEEKVGQEPNTLEDVKQSVEQTVDGIDDAIEQANEMAEEVVEQAAEDMQTGYEMTVQDINNAVSSETE